MMTAFASLPAIAPLASARSRHASTLPSPSTAWSGESSAPSAASSTNRMAGSAYAVDAKRSGRSHRMTTVIPPIEGRGVAKLYFRYGTMDSAKSMNLLAVAHNYRKQGKRVLLVKPRIDSRFGNDKISSRSGLEATADLIVDHDSVLDPRD